MKRVLVAIVALVALSTAAHAQVPGETPLFSMDRASIGVSTNYVWYQSVGTEATPAFRKEFELGALAAYNLVAQPGGRAPLLSGTYSLNYGVDNKLWRHRLGLTLVLWKGSDR